MKIDSTKGVLEINRLIRKDMTQFEVPEVTTNKKVFACVFTILDIYMVFYIQRGTFVLIIANSLYKML